jgi:hypothetical protein
MLAIAAFEALGLMQLFLFRLKWHSIGAEIKYCFSSLNASLASLVRNFPSPFGGS